MLNAEIKQTLTIQRLVQNKNKLHLQSLDSAFNIQLSIQHSNLKKGKKKKKAPQV